MYSGAFQPQVFASALACCSLRFLILCVCLGYRVDESVANGESLMCLSEGVAADRDRANTDPDVGNQIAIDGFPSTRFRLTIVCTPIRQKAESQIKGFRVQLRVRGWVVTIRFLVIHTQICACARVPIYYYSQPFYTVFTRRLGDVTYPYSLPSSSCFPVPRSCACACACTCLCYCSSSSCLAFLSCTSFLVLLCFVLVCAHSLFRRLFEMSIPLLFPFIFISLMMQNR